MRADYDMARQLGEELLGLSERSDELPLHVLPHYAAGFTCFCLGELLRARSHLEEGIAHYNPAQRSIPVFRAGQDPGVACRFYAALTLWLLGYPDQALARAQDGLVLATELAHPFSNAFALVGVSMVERLRRDEQDVYDHAEATVNLSTEQGFPSWLALGTVMRGWALTALGQRRGRDDTVTPRYHGLACHWNRIVRAVFPGRPGRWVWRSQASRRGTRRPERGMGGDGADGRTLVESRGASP